MSSAGEIVQEWIDQHDELKLDGKTVKHDGERLGAFRENGRCSFGPDDGGVRGKLVEVDGDWLYVDGERAYWERGEMNRMTGRFAVQPWHPRRPEIDGPIPEE